MKASKREYPRRVRFEYYKHDTDRRDYHNIDYVIEETFNDDMEESKYYESMNHEANVSIIYL